MSSRRMHSPWGLLLLVTLGGAQAWGGPRHGRFSAPIHRPTLSPSQELRPQSRSREALRVGKRWLWPGKLRPSTGRPSDGPLRQAPVGTPPKPLVEPEPPPAGEIAVRWALPKRRDLPVKILALPSYAATTLGELRGHTAILVGQPLSTHTGLCRSWLSALPSGYVCAAEVNVEPGYLSSPPAQEKSSGWQRFRYGVVSALVTRLRGTGSFLRQILHKGDGVTVTQARGAEVQLIGRQWLPKSDVQLYDPPDAPAVKLDSVPPGQRLAWAVPPVGEDGVPIFLPKSDAGPVAYLPRYGVLYLSEGTESSPGRQAVVLPESTRVALRAVGSSKPAWVSASQFEVETQQLRRVLPMSPPPGISADEHWIDIHLSEQVAIAYQGAKPIFAALVSTGIEGSTPPGSFYIYRKYLTQTMANLAGAASQYDFREVPHAQFFNGRIGLHAVLWHDKLGHAVSHGCVNLSPPAAEQFFSFTSPDLPIGWHTITTPSHRGGPSLPRGTRVIVRK